VLLARELSCALVEGGDLTVRDGRLFLKTLRGLQPIEVLLRGVPGSSVDPLELESGAAGVPGLLAAARDHVAILNNPGSGLAEAPALAAFLPDLAMHLLGQPLALPSVPTVWLERAADKAKVLANPRDWCLRPALDAGVPPVALAAGVVRAGASRAVAVRRERGALTLGGALPRRRGAGTSSPADPPVPGAGPSRMAGDAGRSRLRAR
jgi:uncharacterized circularly permuted ATP-grasp superfamily protein